MKIKNKKKIILFIVFLVSLCVFMLTSASAEDLTISVSGLDSPEGSADTVKIVLLLTVIALAPSILVLMTGFTRILIVLSFVRNALGLQQTPPNQVLIGLALFLTFFSMTNIFAQINDEALQPYINNEITQDEAIDNALKPMRNYMLNQMSDDKSKSDLNTFLAISGSPRPETSYDEIKTEVIIPAFIISELRKAFIIGFFIYVPFLIIDLVVASTLMSLGMMMLPPAMVAMPFKLILFLIADGWSMIVTALMISFD